MSASQRNTDNCTDRWQLVGILGVVLSQLALAAVQPLFQHRLRPGVERGKDPTTPALHYAITRSGLKTISDGTQIIGNARRPSRAVGRAISSQTTKETMFGACRQQAEEENLCCRSDGDNLAAHHGSDKRQLHRNLGACRSWDLPS